MRLGLWEGEFLDSAVRARVFSAVLFLLSISLYSTLALLAEQTPAELFNSIYAGCHNATPPPRTMSGETLRALAPEKFFFATSAR